MDADEEDDVSAIGSEVERGFGAEPEFENDRPTIAVGIEFDSYDQLCSAITDYKYSNYVDLYKRSSRGLESAQNRATKRRYCDALVYSEIDFCCKQGGREYKSRSKGIRKEQSTYLKECPFRIKIRASRNGQKLYVKEIVGEHNHPVSKEAFMDMPNQRRLDPDIKEQAAEMLHMKANRKMLQNHLIHATGKSVILKDLHNLYTRSKPKSKCNFQELVDAMRKVKDAVITTFIDGDNVLRAIYFQTREMKNTFSTYPELLFIDATYKLNDLRMPLYVLLAVDGNGESEIVCLWIVQCEEKETIASLLVEFKQHNDSWSLTKCVMSDKDMTERNVIKEHFPQTNLLICLFHTMRTFKREISCDKLGISQGERTLCLELLTKMAYAQSETAYTILYDEFKESVPKIATDYFDDNWHGIREQWVDGLKNSQCNYLNRTNNRVESINAKLKSVITRYSGMTQFFNDLMQCLSSLQVERDHRAIEVATKRKVTSINPTSALGQYMELLTPYAFEYVKKQFELSEKVKIKDDIDGDSCTIDAREGELVTSIDNCSCVFSSSMKLPCRHILATRCHKGLHRFDESLCAERWKLQYFLVNHRTSQNHQCDGFEPDVAMDMIYNDPQPSKVLTEQEKYKKAFQIVQKLSQHLSSLGMKEFEEGYQVLKTIKSKWDEGKKVAIIDINNSSDGIDDMITDSTDDMVTDDIDAANEEGNDATSMDDVEDLNDDSALDTLLQAIETVDAYEATNLSEDTDDDNRRVLIERNVEKEIQIGEVQMPPKMQKKGRPKGSGLTVIGLPKKVNRASTKPTTFLKKSQWEKSKLMLSWFVDDEKVTDAMRNNILIEEEDVEVRPECVPMKCLDENVSMSTVRRYFTNDAWVLVESVMATMSKKQVWLCSSCSEELGTSESIVCESCLEWNHLRCVGVKKPPKKKEWFCRGCYST